MRPRVLLGIDKASPEGNAIEQALRTRCHTRVVHSLAEALAAVTEQSYDAVVVAERAFRDHGVDLLALVASSSPGTHRLLLAREPNSNLLRRAINEAGVQRVFFAPLSASRIADAVAQLTLEGREATRP
jgi:DNA-binding NtrC family response regulator